MQRRVVVVGKNRLAAECLRVVVAAGDKAIAVADPSDSGVDGWQPSFRRCAESLGVPVRSAIRINDPSFVADLGRTRPDYILSFQAAQLMRAELLAVPALAAINLHFGPLPRYRGVAPIAWALINGERSTGVTLHHIDAGIDTGPSIRSSVVPISREDTGRSLYDKCTEAGIELFRQTWPSLRRRVLRGKPQRSRDALYYNRFSLDFSLRVVRWDRDCESVANWIRAYIFPPFQLPVVTVGGREIEIGGVRWDRGFHRGRGGEILEVSDEGITIAAPGGRVTLVHLRHAGTPLNAADFMGAGLVQGANLS